MIGLEGGPTPAHLVSYTEGYGTATIRKRDDGTIEVVDADDVIGSKLSGLVCV